MIRRNFLAGILAASAAPAFVRAASLMPVKVMDSGIALLDWSAVEEDDFTIMAKAVRTDGAFVLTSMTFANGRLDLTASHAASPDFEIFFPARLPRHFEMRPGDRVNYVDFLPEIGA